MAVVRVIAIILVAVGLIGLAFYGLRDRLSPPTHETITIKGETFTLELANTPALIQQGLMGRESIPDDGGMLFIFPGADYRGFWMGHCLVDIDIIFLSPTGVVTAVHEMKAQPPQRPDESETAYRERMPQYQSVRPAQFAIELKAGSLNRLGIRPGDRIALDYLRLKELAR